MCGPEINEIKFGDQIEAWQRQLPHLPCPLKFEEGRLFKRQRNGDSRSDVLGSDGRQERVQAGD
jgi:hypothetical protein